MNAFEYVFLRFYALNLNVPFRRKDRRDACTSAQAQTAIVFGVPIAFAFLLPLAALHAYLPGPFYAWATTVGVLTGAVLLHLTRRFDRYSLTPERALPFDSFQSCTITVVGFFMAFVLLGGLAVLTSTLINRP